MGDTFKEIEAKRRKLDEELDKKENEGKLTIFVPDVPSWNQVVPTSAPALVIEDHSVIGVRFQQCGGGRRILKKKIGGA